MDSSRTLNQLSEMLAKVSGQKSDEPKVVAANLAELIAQLGSGESLSRFSVLVQELVRATIREFELPIRQALSEKLSSDERVPRTILLTLVDDQVEVAWPILKNSLALEEADLIRIALAGSERHRLAISQRIGVCATVSAAICTFGEVDVLEALLLNESSSILNTTFTRIAFVARVSSRLHSPLAMRNDLPRILALEMLEWVEAALHIHLARRIGYSESELRTLLRDAVRTSAVAEVLEAHVRVVLQEAMLRDEPPSDAEFFVILDGLPRSERGLKELATSVFLREALMAVRKCCRAAEPDGFAYLCRAANASKMAFGKLCEHFGPVDAESQLEKAGWILKGKRIFDSLDQNQAHGRLSLWLQSS